MVRAGQRLKEQKKEKFELSKIMKELKKENLELSKNLLEMEVLKQMIEDVSDLQDMILEKQEMSSLWQESRKSSSSE